MDIFETFDKKLKTFMDITENDLFLQNDGEALKDMKLHY